MSQPFRENQKLSRFFVGILKNEMSQQSHAPDDVQDGVEGRNRDVKNRAVLIIFRKAFQVTQDDTAAVQCRQQILMNQLDYLAIAIADCLIPTLMSLCHVSPILNEIQQKQLTLSARMSTSHSLSVGGQSPVTAKWNRLCTRDGSWFSASVSLIFAMNFPGRSLACAQ